MRLKNTSFLDTNKIMEICNKYSKYFKVEYDGDLEVVINPDKYPFANAADGILVCDPHDYGVVGGYGGLTYQNGAVSVYTYQAERAAWNGRMWYLYENRILHEVLHHFRQPCHDMENWLLERHLFLWLLYKLTGSNGESIVGSHCERMFYLHLLKNVNESEYDCSGMDYTGVLI